METPNITVYNNPLQYSFYVTVYRSKMAVSANENEMQWAT